MTYARLLSGCIFSRKENRKWKEQRISEVTTKGDNIIDFPIKPPDLSAYDEAGL